jgi:hypothetical protein
MYNIILWILKYEFFQTLPPDLKMFLKDEGNEFHRLHNDKIQEFSQLYETNSSTYDYFISRYGIQYKNIKNGNIDVPISNIQLNFFWLCNLITEQAKSKRLINEFDDTDRQLFRAFIVYLINRKY